MSLLIFAFIVAVVVLILTIWSKRTTEEAWKRMAANLRLTYYDIGVPSLRGQFRDRNVHVTVSREGHGSRSQTFTRIEVHLQRFLKTGFQLERQGYLQVAKNFIGARDIKVGHPEFDAVVVVKGRDEEAIRHLFQSKSLRKACQSLVARQRYSGVKITNKKLEVIFLGKVSDTSRIRAALKELADVAEVFEKKAVSKIRPESPAPPPLPTREKRPVVPEEWHGPDVEAEAVSMSALEETSPESDSAEPEEGAQRESENVLEDLEESDATVDVTGGEQTAASVDETISLALIEETLLEEEIGRYEAGQRFDQLFKGEPVRWRSPLQAIEPGSSDRVFGHGSGWIARFESGDLHVKYRIGSERRKRFENEIGSPVELAGTLIKYDPFTETLYLESDDPQSSAPDRIISEIVPYSERMKKEMQSRPGEVREFS